MKRVTSEMTPICSAMGMNSSGGMGPNSSSVRRQSASAATNRCALSDHTGCKFMVKPSCSAARRTTSAMALRRWMAFIMPGVHTHGVFGSSFFDSSVAYSSAATTSPGVRAITG